MTTDGGNVWDDVSPQASRTLSPAHRIFLEEGSAISEEVIAARGYYSLNRGAVTELVNLNVLSSQALSATGWLAIPIYRPDGFKHGEQVRLFGASERAKYLWPSGQRLSFDVHPDCLDDLTNPSVDLIITEGTKKSDAILSAARDEGHRYCVISLAGYSGWKVKYGEQSVASPDFQDILWENRKVYVVPDSDFKSNADVLFGWTELTRYVAGKTGPHRTFLVIVPSAGMTKQGADDYLAAGNTLAGLLGHAQSPQYVALDPAPAARPLSVRMGPTLMATHFPKIPYLMAPLIPAKSITLIAGHSGTLKTWAALDLALEGALGLPWLDHPDLKADLGPFRTMYVNKEMQEDIIIDRLFKYRANTRFSGHPDWDAGLERFMLVSEAALDLNVESQRDRLESAIEAYHVDLVVLDSLSMSWHGDENSASEVGAFYAHLRGITERTDCAWILIHHLLKTGSKVGRGDPLTVAIRGSGQLSQQADVAIMLANYAVENDESGDRLVAMTHAKARTDRELPAWLCRFGVEDTIRASYRYLSPLTEAKARAAGTVPLSTQKMREWILEELRAMPAMRHTAAGLRSPILVALLQANWTVNDSDPPSDRTLRRYLMTLAEEGIVTSREQSQSKGALYRLPDPEEIPDETPTQPGHHPPSPTTFADGVGAPENGLPEPSSGA